MTVIRTPIENEAQWKSLRAPIIGASEIAALLGCHQFKTAYGLAAQKLGLIPPDPETSAMRRGKRLEPIAHDDIREKFPPWRLEVPGAYWHDPDLRVGATPDLFAIDSDLGRGVIEIKSVEPSQFQAKWHNVDGELEPPLGIAVQVICQAWLTGAAFAGVAAIVVGHGIETHFVDVPIRAGIIDRIKSEAAAFWRLVDAGRLPDPDYGRDAELIRQLLRQDAGTEIDLRSDNELPKIVAERAAAAIARKELDETVRIADARILHRIGEHQRARFAGGVITAKTIQKKAYEVPATSYRQLRIKRDEARE